MQIIRTWEYFIFFLFQPNPEQKPCVIGEYFSQVCIMSGKPLVIYSNPNPRFEILMNSLDLSIVGDFEFKFLAEEDSIESVLSEMSLFLFDMGINKASRLKEIENKAIRKALKKIPVLIIGDGKDKEQLNLGKKLRALAILNPPDEAESMKMLWVLINRILKEEK